MNIIIQKLPETLEAFLELRKELGSSPEGSGALLLTALQVYEAQPKLGEQLILLILDLSLLKPGDTYKNFAIGSSLSSRIKSQFKQYKGNMIRSYVSGTHPSNNYEIPSWPVTYTFSRNAYSGSEEVGIVKIFVASSGADSPRPIQLHRNDQNIWKVKEFSSILMGVKEAPVIDSL